MRPRVTVVEQVYHQLPDQQPTSVETKYQRWLDSDEQPYVRNITVGAEWQPLDCGWVLEASLLVLLNTEGADRRNVTDEGRAVVDAMVIEVSFARDTASPETHVLVNPRESCRLEPAALDHILVRCRAGKCRATVQLFPA